MNKKRKILTAALIAVAAAVTAGSTLAYFTSRDTARNVFTVGSVKIALNEPSWDPDEEHKIVPGSEYPKDPKVANTGTTDAYVRMRVTISDYAALSEQFTEDELLAFLDGIDSSLWTYTGETEIEDDSITFAWYYNTALPAAQSTESLFSSVKIPEKMTSGTAEALNGELSVTVEADAIQTETFEGPEEAFKKFDETMI